MLLQSLDGTVDGKPFGDAAEIDANARVPVPNVSIRKQGDMRGRSPGGSAVRFAAVRFATVRQQTHQLQFFRDGDVEQAAGTPMQFDGCLQDRISRSRDLDGIVVRASIETTDIAVAIVKAHAFVDVGNGAEGGLDGRFPVTAATTDLNLDQGSEQRPGASNAIGDLRQRQQSF